MLRKNFITLELAVVGALLFGIGMSMCLLPEWDLFNQGVVITAIGGVELLGLGIIRHIIDGKKWRRPNWKLIGKTIFGIVAALIMGLGMVMIMVWDTVVLGIVVGIVGILMLLGLIPMSLGLK